MEGFRGQGLGHVESSLGWIARIDIWVGVAELSSCIPYLSFRLDIAVLLTRVCGIIELSSSSSIDGNDAEGGAEKFGEHNMW